MSDRTVAIVQARTGSSRLPGKVLENVAGRPLLDHVLERAQESRLIDAVVLATPDNPADGVLRDIARNRSVAFFQGSGDDVLDRYYRAAVAHVVDVIVRITGDCPLIDPDVIDACVALFRSSGCDYASNTQPPTYPDGLDVEVFSGDALSAAWKEASADSEREHVTPYIWKNADRFRLSTLRSPFDLSHMRWIVDEPEDLAFIRAVYEHLYDGDVFKTGRILQLLDKYPELADLNAKFTRNEGYLKSLQAEGSL